LYDGLLVKDTGSFFSVLLVRLPYFLGGGPGGGGGGAAAGSKDRRGRVERDVGLDSSFFVSDSRGEMAARYRDLADIILLRVSSDLL
jgi:hypothetical protein